MSVERRKLFIFFTPFKLKQRVPDKAKAKATYPKITLCERHNITYYSGRVSQTLHQRFSRQPEGISQHYFARELASAEIFIGASFSDLICGLLERNLMSENRILTHC
jgi:hypothetical protein